MEGRKYRVNPFCPNCGEEHAYYTICITEEEQQQVDKFYEEKKYRSELESLLGPCALYLEREFRCPVCGAVFKKVVGIYREANLNYKSKNLIPMGVHPVF